MPDFYHLKNWLALLWFGRFGQWPRPYLAIYSTYAMFYSKDGPKYRHKAGQCILQAVGQVSVIAGSEQGACSCYSRIWFTCSCLTFCKGSSCTSSRGLLQHEQSLEVWQCTWCSDGVRCFVWRKHKTLTKETYLTWARPYAFWSFCEPGSILIESPDPSITCSFKFLRQLKVFPWRCTCTYQSLAKHRKHSSHQQIG